MLANHPTLRRTLGFALLAIAAWLMLEVAVAFFGAVLAIAVTVLVFAAAGYIVYLVVRVFSPTAAEKVRNLIRGHPPTSPGAGP
jgi:hypothetical protein